METESTSEGFDNSNMFVSVERLFLRQNKIPQDFDMTRMIRLLCQCEHPGVEVNH